MRSASVRLQLALAAATKCCHSAAAMPAPASSRPVAASARRGPAPLNSSAGTDTSAMATNTTRCSTHQAQGCMSNTCWDTSAAPTASSGSSTITAHSSGRGRPRREARPSDKAVMPLRR